MTFDEALEHRMYAALGDAQGISEKRMMGGICFFPNDNMIGEEDRPHEGEPSHVRRLPAE
jgi:hypothetical protein